MTTEHLRKVISGGQTGVDTAALIAAKSCGIATGGWMPRGFRRQDGDHPEFAHVYGMKEHFSREYPPRTIQNVKDADATLRIAEDFSSPGEILTGKALALYKRPQLSFMVSKTFTPLTTELSLVGIADPIPVIADWIDQNRINILNVAGNSEKTCPGIELFVVGLLQAVFMQLGSRRPQ